MTSHASILYLSLLAVLVSLVAVAGKQGKVRRIRVDCRMHPFFSKCRGISAKRSLTSPQSSYSSFPSSSSSSSSSSLLSSPSSSGPRLTEDFIKRLMLLSTQSDEDRIDNGAVDKDDENLPSSLHQNQQQRHLQKELQQQRQKPRDYGVHRQTYDDRDREEGEEEQERRLQQYESSILLGRDRQLRHSILRDLLSGLGSKDYGHQDFYGSYGGFDTEDTT